MAIPSISSAAILAVPDSNTRGVLQAMADFIALRNGDTGDGQNAFLTLGDLTGNSAAAKALASALALPIASGINAPGTPLEQLGQELEDRILASAAWQSMFSRIDLIAAPDSLPGSAAWQLLQEAKARGAAIQVVSDKLQTATLSFANSISTMTAAINANAAAIQHESQVRADADSAVASQLDLTIVTTGQNTAAIQNEISVRTNSDNAIASAINTLWAKVGNANALVQSGTQIAVNNVGSSVGKFDQLQAIITNPTTGLVDKTAVLRSDLSVTNNTVDGLSGKWGIKIDLNGYVAGVALNSGVSTGGKAESSFIVLADTFAVGAPGKPGIVPFAIDAVSGLVRVRGDLIATGTVAAQQLQANSVDRSKIALKAVGGAQIDDLAVDTLKIGANAVTVPVYMSGASTASHITPGTLVQVGQITAYYPDSVSIVALATWQAGAASVGGNTRIELRVDGWTFAAGSDSNIGGYALSHSFSAKVQLGAGYHTFSIHFGNDWNAGSWDLGTWSCTLLGVMR